MGLPDLPCRQPQRNQISSKSAPLPLSGFVHALRTHLGTTCLSTGAFLTVHPYRAPTLPRSPPNAFTRRVCLALCGNTSGLISTCSRPRPTPLRRPATTQLVLLSLSHGPLLFTPLRYSSHCRRRILLLWPENGLYPLLLHPSQSNSLRVPSHCISAAAHWQASLASSVCLPRSRSPVAVSNLTIGRGLSNPIGRHPFVTPLSTRLDSSRQNAHELYPRPRRHATNDGASPHCWCPPHRSISLRQLHALRRA
jgi:hypothetical protein